MQASPTVYAWYLHGYALGVERTAGPVPHAPDGVPDMFDRAAFAMGLFRARDSEPPEPAASVLQAVIAACEGAVPKQKETP